MANIPLQSITFPGLSDKYTTPTVDATLTQTGAAADAKKTGDEIGAIKNDLSEKADKSEALSAFVVETETGSIASFTDGADDVPVKDLTVAIEPVQSGSGDPSPENIRPISGWTGANVTACGVNVWDEQWELGEYSETTGAPSPSSSCIRSKSASAIRVVPNTQYYIKCPTNSVVFSYDANDNFINYHYVGSNSVFTVPSNAFYLRFRASTSYGTTYNHDISINYPSTDTAYHAYNGSSVSIDWTTEAGTVYGGTLNVTTGVLTVDRAYKNVALSNFEYNKSINCLLEYSSYNTFADAKAPANNNTKFNAVADAIGINSAGAINGGSDGLGITATKDVYLRSSGLTSKAEYLTAFPNGINVVYELATPQTYQLTPQEVKSILGQNNIFADTGNVTVQYRADTKLYIDKVLNA